MVDSIEIIKKFKRATKDFNRNRKNLRIISSTMKKYPMKMQIVYLLY
jgi:hypothetical protein